MNEKLLPTFSPHSHTRGDDHVHISLKGPVDHDGHLSKGSPFTSQAKEKLVTVCIICGSFMVIEFMGGLLSDSLAIMTDAAHLLSDLSGFLISIYALQIAQKKPNDRFTFGYYRAEIVGALASVFIIWILTGMLLMESTTRIFKMKYDVDGKVMLITSLIGFVFNGIMVYVLHSKHDHHHHDHHENGHESGHEEDVKNEHEHFGISPHHFENQGIRKVSDSKVIKEEFNEDSDSVKVPSPRLSPTVGHGKNEFVEMNNLMNENREEANNESVFLRCDSYEKFENYNKNITDKKYNNKIHKKKSFVEKINRDDFNLTPNIKRRSELETPSSKNLGIYKKYFSIPHIQSSLTRKLSRLHHVDQFIGLSTECSHNHHQKENINVQAALIHIIGDIIQSIGVIVAAGLIYLFPNFQIIDPLTTIMFSIIVAFTTLPIIKQCVIVIMEGNNDENILKKIKEEILKVKGVGEIGCFHLFFLSLDKKIIIGKVSTIERDKNEEILSKILQNIAKFDIFHVNIEITSDNLCNCTE